jgi:hypothetical protein
LNCVWVSEGASSGCQDVLNSCESISNNKEWCETGGAAGSDNECVWVSKGASEGCQEVVNSCESITSNKEWCETEGAVKTTETEDAGTETTIKTIECIWFEEGSINKETGKQCKKKFCIS